MRKAASTLVMFLTLYLAGCGGSSGTPLGYVTGTVTLDGQPLQAATIIIAPAEGSSSKGVSNAEGEYEMQFKFNKPGAQVGTHPIIVSVYVEVPEKLENADVDEQTHARMMKKFHEENNPVPKKWRDGSMTITVESGRNTFDIELVRENAGG